MFDTFVDIIILYGLYKIAEYFVRIFYPVKQDIDPSAYSLYRGGCDFSDNDISLHDINKMSSELKQVGLYKDIYIPLDKDSD